MNAVIEKFDRYLARRGLRFQTVIIGGAALIAMGIIARATRDVDCLWRIGRIASPSRPRRRSWTPACPGSRRGTAIPPGWSMPETRLPPWRKGLDMSTVLPFSTADLACIGMRFAGGSLQSGRDRRVDIERTILDVTGFFPEDTRLASVFLSWIKVHGNYVIVEKLAKFAAKRMKDTETANPWLSLTAAWAVECGYHKWKKLVKKMPAPTYLYPPAVSESAIRLKGAVPWLAPLGFRIPQNSFRIREDDVLPPEKLVRRNLQYRNRYLFGASWRADIITAIQRGITSPAEISRAVGCSYEPAYRVSREYGMITYV